MADSGGMKALFAAMHAASRCDPAPAAALRLQRLAALDRLLRDNIDAFAAAIDADFGGRSSHETRLLELFPSLEGIHHARTHVRRWMRAERRSVSMWFLPGRAEVRMQPLGVVGIVVPWNYPLYLAVAPLTAALAAGNRALLKMSEFTPATAHLFAELVSRHFGSDEIAVIEGDADVGREFVQLPFDHLLFTGSTAVGREVMRAAAANLTPVTLELGGKSPAIVAPGFPLAKAAERIMVGKCLNAGQTCIAPDYVLLPAGSEEAFVAAARSVVTASYPQMAAGRGRSADYSAIVNDRHYRRLQGYLDDARARGARIVPLCDGKADPATRCLPPVAVLDVDDGMAVMREEIFGPILPLIPCPSPDAAIAFVNARPRPLALYVFDHDAARVERVLDETVAGGVTVNDTLLHIAQDNLPFGGVGPSGMGHYHGREGFLALSKQKAVFRQSRLNGMGLFRPPYGHRFERLIRLLLR